MGAKSKSTVRQRTLAEHEADRAERRRTFPRVMLIGLLAWSSFFVLDLHAALVISRLPVLFFAAIRLLGAAMIATVYFLTRRPETSDRLFVVLELGIFAVAAEFISIMAVVHGGLTSPYVHGISLVILMQVIGIPSSAWRALAAVSGDLLAYPLTMLVAAQFVPRVAAQLRSPAALNAFFHHFFFVVATAIIGATASHVLWATRRQVYEARRLGRYRLKARLASGGMGEVWAARDDVLRRDVALKILRDPHAVGAHARFEREAHAASALKNPHTIRVYDFGASDDGISFIAMEYLDGIDLATLVDRYGALEPAHVVCLARQIASSLAEAHDQGVVHRDIKPSNLFMVLVESAFDFIKVLDFGIAKVRSSDEEAMTQAGWVGGTPGFMSPEVCVGREADVRSDVYSLGATLYFLLTGAAPFTAANDRALMAAHVGEKPVPPSKRIKRAIPAALEELVLRALAKRPEDRPQSMRDFDLELALIEQAFPWSTEDAQRFWSNVGRRDALKMADTLAR